MKICNVKKNKYNVAMDPGIKFNKSNKQKIKNPVNQIIKVFWGHDLNQHKISSSFNGINKSS